MSSSTCSIFSWLTTGKRFQAESILKILTKLLYYISPGNVYLYFSTIIVKSPIWLHWYSTPKQFYFYQQVKPNICVISFISLLLEMVSSTSDSRCPSPTLWDDARLRYHTKIMLNAATLLQEIYLNNAIVTFSHNSPSY